MQWPRSEAARDRRGRCDNDSSGAPASVGRVTLLPFHAVQGAGQHVRAGEGNDRTCEFAIAVAEGWRRIGGRTDGFVTVPGSRLLTRRHGSTKVSFLRQRLFTLPAIAGRPPLAALVRPNALTRRSPERPHGELRAAPSMTAQRHHLAARAGHWAQEKEHGHELQLAAGEHDLFGDGSALCGTSGCRSFGRWRIVALNASLAMTRRSGPRFRRGHGGALRLPVLRRASLDGQCAWFESEACLPSHHTVPPKDRS